jgi:hypothetical protein
MYFWTPEGASCDLPTGGTVCNNLSDWSANSQPEITLQMLEAYKNTLWFLEKFNMKQYSHFLQKMIIMTKYYKVIKRIKILLIHVNSPTVSGRLPLSATIVSKIFLKIKGIFTNKRYLPLFDVRTFFFVY